jgi:plasmid stabilization system protein ParE
MSRKIVWNDDAKYSFFKIIQYLRKRSPQNAIKLENVIFSKIEFIVSKPEFFMPDKYKRDNKLGSYRAFEQNSLRVSYFFDDNFLVITKVRHTKQKPLKY